jgi:UDP-2-acetamido-3-amino-2,3-dideoxy-glucuronate N-acetyltransferase
MKELVDAGNIGKVRHFYSNRLNLGKVRTEENILWSFAPHDISIMNYLMGGPPTDVRASGQIILQPDIHDVTLTVMKWQDSVMGHIYVSWLHPFKEHRFVVVGDKAMLVFDDTKDSDKLVLYDRGIDFIKGAPVKRDKDAEVIEYSNNEPLKAELEHFLECCRSRQKPLTDGREGVEVLRVLAAAQKAIGSRTQRPGSGKAKREFTVHPTAVVDRGAQIGKGTRIWHFSHICSTAKLGERCSLGQNVYVANNVVIGNNVKIQNNVSVYEGVVLEDDCFCGPSMVFTNVRNPRSAFPRNTADDYQTTYVRKGTTLGANCTIVCGISIGEHAFIAAGAVVNKDVKPHAMMVGVPARQIGWACECGMKLTGTGSRLHCADCGRHYRYENDRIHQAAKPA